MNSSGDDERPKLSWKEIDQRRSGGGTREEARPRGRWAEAQAKRASDEYKKQLDGMFSDAQGGSEGAALADAIRDAHGTPGLAEACIAYRDAVGWPIEAELLGLFLDAGDQALVVGALEVILEGVESGGLEMSKGLRRQVDSLAEDFNAAIADIAEEIVERA